MYYCINNLKKGENTAGIKAPKDVYEICSRCGFGEIVFYEPHKYKYIMLTRIGAIPTGISNWRRVEKTAKYGDWVIIQHPNENIVIGNLYISRLKEKGIHFIALIHDLESLRRSLSGKGNELAGRNRTADNELLAKCDYIICHNQAMKRYLVEQGIDKEKVFELGIFDYLHDCKKEHTRKKEDPIVIAGNLQKGKCDYLYKIMEADEVLFSVNLYGPNFTQETNREFVHYFGSSAPEELPDIMEGSFGLVWDGTEIDRCTGNAGEYLKYNNPHKCSLFLASGLPVIIWKQAALATFIEENGLGITINSLNEVGSAIKAMSDTEYIRLVNNTKEFAKKLKTGHYLKSVLSQMGIFHSV